MLAYISVLNFLCPQNHLIFRISGFVFLLENLNAVFDALFTQLENINLFRFMRK